MYSERFEAIEQLGNQKKRKFATVEKCLDHLTGEFVVSKTVLKTEQNQLALSHLRKEATYHFNFPGLPAIIAIEENATKLTIYSNYQKGIPVDIFLQSAKNKLKSLTTVVEQMSELLTHIHSQQIVHLDLKPSNLLVHETKTGELEVALIDFGLSLRTPVDHHRKMIFPLGFAAPEQVLNELSIIDPRTDYFALGIVIWYCLEGKLPFQHSNPSIATNLQITYPLPPLRKKYSQIDPILQKLCAKHTFKVPPNRMNDSDRIACLKEGMNSRYTSLNELLADWKNQKPARKKWWYF
jgi:serine/threonine protein kinase